MVTKFNPLFNKVYFINRYTMLHILEGSGAVQVDFKNYFDLSDRIIFLEKGQYIKFLSDGFLVRKIEFNDEQLFRNKDVRVLFKHLVSLGYIQFNECEACQRYLEDNLIDNANHFIDISSEQWYWQNPFNATKDEYHIIFDVKDVIDQEYRNHLSSGDIATLISDHEINPHVLYADKVGISIKGLLGTKRFIEAQKEIAFTDKSMKEIAYDFGYKDPAYFNRVFKSNTGVTPGEFKESIAFEKKDAFVHELLELIQAFHMEERGTDFYAEKMNLSVKALSNKVKSKLQISIGRLIREEIIRTAKQYLVEHRPIHEVANTLGFQESNHFSTFFKHHTAITPTEFQHQKYNQ